MKNLWLTPTLEFSRQDIVNYFETLKTNPIKVLALIIDVIIVLFILYKLIKIIKKTRAWQLIKGITFLIVITILSSIFELHILNYILTSFMTYGVILLIVIFQPEIRRALEQLRN